MVILIIVVLLAAYPTALDRAAGGIGCFGGLVALWALYLPPRNADGTA
ncbi:hypothetical protein [Streptodolium elevatio]|uniref:Uncharacterized protein n=1 Tax=Streptodolium elevatio TaxID=3157996 RepID=A0ABV3DSI8_9ACTN